MHFNVKNVRRKDWRVIESKDTSGQIFNELDILIKFQPMVEAQAG